MSDSLTVQIVNWPEPTHDIIPWIALVLSSAAFVWQVVSWRRDRSVRLHILQRGTNVENSVLNEFTVQIFISVLNVGNLTTTVTGFGIIWDAVPEGFYAKDDPREADRETYFISEGFEYPRELAINHRIYAEGLLHPGESVSGLLIATTNGQIPPKPATAKVKILVVDHRGGCHEGTAQITNSANVHNRSLERRRQRYP